MFTWREYSSTIVGNDIQLKWLNERNRKKKIQLIWTYLDVVVPLHAFAFRVPHSCGHQMSNTSLPLKNNNETNSLFVFYFLLRNTFRRNEFSLRNLRMYLLLLIDMFVPASPSMVNRIWFAFVRSFGHRFVNINKIEYKSLINSFNVFMFCRIASQISNKKKTLFWRQTMDCDKFAFTNSDVYALLLSQFQHCDRIAILSRLNWNSFIYWLHAHNTPRYWCCCFVIVYLLSFIVVVISLVMCWFLGVNHLENHHVVRTLSWLLFQYKHFYIVMMMPLNSL